MFIHVYHLIRKYIVLFNIRWNYRFILKGTHGYSDWIKRNEKYDPILVRQDIERLLYKPLFSIILPVYNVRENYLKECLDSVIKQYYTNWELCIADDHSTFSYIKDILQEYQDKDSRIKVFYRTENGHISVCSNSALSLAEGEFCIFLDNDDMLAPFALYEVVKAVNKMRDVDLLYSDEDKLMNGIRCRPFFKKKWTKDFLLYMNYVCHLSVYRTSLIRELEGLREGYEGAQDWDLALRVTTRTEKIMHIPQILYHWRVSATSTSLNERVKPYVREAQKRVVNGAIKEWLKEQGK